MAYNEKTLSESIVGSGVEAKSLARVAEPRHLPMVSAKPQPSKADRKDYN